VSGNDGKLHFLSGGGEMGERMRKLDWSRTALGPAADWPQSLKTIIRMMLDSRYAMWMLWGPDITFFCNDAYLPTVGNKRGWVLGARSDLVWEEIWPDVGPRIQHVLTQGEATWDEALLLFLERKGFPEETYHTFSYSPVYGDDNRIAGMLCVVTEVTERVIGERRLRALRDLAARVTGVDSIEASCKRAIDALAQYPADLPVAALYLIDPQGKRAHRIAATRDLPDSDMPSQVALDDTSGPWDFARALSVESGQQIADLPGRGVRMAALPWADLVQNGFLMPLKGGGQDRFTGFLVVGASPRRPLDQPYVEFLDLVCGQVAAAIADAEAYEHERARAEALAEIDRAKTTFFSNVSHEFRTPLTLMLGPVEDALADPQAPQAMRARLEVAHRNALRMLKLVNSLLDFSRIEAGRLQAWYEPTDLAEVTRDLASTFRSAIDRAGLELDVRCGTLSVPVHVDREMWEKVVLNLLSNAFKFTLEGAIAVRLQEDAGWVVLEVEDSGVGVAPEEIPRLFDRFYRVEGTRGRNYEGSGIGLALVQELVKLHGGSIDVRSELGHGTTFSVRMPLGSIHLPQDHLRPARSATSAPVGAHAYVREAERWLSDETGADRQALRSEAPDADRDRRFESTFGARVVLADDNADMRSYVGTLIAPMYEVESVGDGQAALQAIRRKRPELVISDVMMPKLDGYGLLRAIRTDPHLSGLPVILLSARAGDESRIEGLDAGADDYLIKPFAARELLARIGAMLELARLRARNEAQLRESEARLQRALEASSAMEQRFRATFENAAVGIAQVGLDGHWLLVNDRLCQITGYSREELLERTFADITYPEDLGPDLQMVEHLHDGEFQTYTLQKRYVRKNDTLVWVNLTVAMVRTAAGAPDYFISVVEDITERKQAEEELRRAARLKDEFLAMLAHELRNPLAPIRNASEVLSRALPSDPEVQAPISMIRRQTAHLSRLVDDLLDVSRITQGRIQLQREPIDLASVIAQAIETVAPLIREKRQDLSVISRQFQPLYVNGDSARLVQCAVNVLTNAAKYTDAGGHITIETRVEGPHAVIETADDGIGLSAELLPRVFELFVQGDRTLDRAQGGLGIGLSVVQRLIEMHGGEVKARSDGLGKGASFVIRLPRMEAPLAEEPHTEPSASPTRRVLIVDDNIDSADSLAMMLKFDGHETDRVYTAYDALERSVSFRPDVILLDIGLPGIDGYEVARRLRATPGLERLRLVALTGYGQPEDRARTRAAGFDDHLVKPVEFPALERAIAGAAEA
jgi:PAS domain S-box-containing protein